MTALAFIILIERRASRAAAIVLAIMLASVGLFTVQIARAADVGSSIGKTGACMPTSQLASEP